MNQYVGLEQSVNWENCGVGRGNKLTEKEYLKLKEDEQALCSRFELNGETFYFLPKKLGKTYIIRHNGDAVPVKEFFTSRLFTQDVLRSETLEANHFINHLDNSITEIQTSLGDRALQGFPFLLQLMKGTHFNRVEKAYILSKAEAIAYKK
jgi:hypothetical protein